jgi:CheY-like chemotaxis protein
MIVALIVITTIIAFIIVDLMLRTLLKKADETRTRKARAQALDAGLKLDVSEEASTLKRVKLEDPIASILAVDDEEIILSSFRKILVLAGYSIDSVEKGSEALGLIRKNDYDFIFTDLKMPEMDGVELTKAAKHLRPDIDVIVITGYASIETAVETVKSGAMAYMEKPFTEDELLEFLKTAVIKRQDNLEKQMRHKVRLIKPGISEAKSRYELNVPAGVFISPEHAWAKIELNGMVRIGPDDLIRKVFEKVDRVDLPENGKSIKKGETLFSIRFDEYNLEIPSPLSGQVTSVNSEHTQHPEWLAIKPFELSWMCAIEPSNLTEELPGLKIGRDSVDWYRSEIARYEVLANQFLENTAQLAASETEESRQDRNAEYTKLLKGFSKPTLQA